MTDPVGSAFIALLGAILGAVLAKFIELRKPKDRKYIKVDTNYVRTTGDQYNEITALRTDQDAHFSIYTLYDSRKHHLNDQLVNFTVFSDHDFYGKTPITEQGPFVCLDTNLHAAACDVSIHVDGATGKIHIKSMPPKYYFSILIACSYSHFVEFGSPTDNLTVSRLEKFDAIYAREILHRNYLMLLSFFALGAIIVAIVEWVI